jgi:hypothetical protein
LGLAIASTSEDRVYFLGYPIDRGTDSARVVKFVRESPYTCLLGNHEQMLLDTIAESNHRRRVRQLPFEEAAVQIDPFQVRRRH